MVNQGHWTWYHSIDWYGFLLVFYSNFVPNEVFEFKYAVTLKTGLGFRHQLIREPMTSYWRSIVTMALSRIVTEIFDVEKYRDLEIRVRCHSMSLIVVPFETMCMVSY